jgi:hypothetical protein
MAASADTTPKGPSYAPPSGTESRCEPTTTPGRPAATAASGSPHHAHWFPARSTTRSRPRAAASPANHSASSASAGVQANLLHPPVRGDRPTGSMAAHSASNVTPQPSRMGIRTPLPSATASAAG